MIGRGANLELETRLLSNHSYLSFRQTCTYARAYLCSLAMLSLQWLPQELSYNWLNDRHAIQSHCPSAQTAAAKFGFRYHHSDNLCDISDWTSNEGFGVIVHRFSKKTITILYNLCLYRKQKRIWMNQRSTKKLETFWILWSWKDDFRSICVLTEIHLILIFVPFVGPSAKPFQMLCF